MCFMVLGDGLRSWFEPLIAMSGDEVVVVEMRVGAMDAINFSKLARAERFVFIEAPQAFEQALPSQDFVQTSDAAAEAVRGIKEGGVAVGDLDSET